MYLNMELVPRAVTAAPIPNYTDPATRGWTIVVIAAVFGPLAAIAVILRIISRFRLQRNVGIDDYIFLGAMVPAFGYMFIECFATKMFYFDHHVWDIPLEGLPSMQKMSFVGCIFYILSTCLIKMSILCFYRRLTDRSISAAFIYTVWTLMALEMCQIAICLGTLCFNCIPLSAYWNRFVPSWAATHTYSCLPTGPALFTQSIISVIQDLITTAMPFSLFLGMKISMRKKVAMSATFACGLVVCAIGACRAYAIHYAAFQTDDFTWHAYDFITASMTEVLLASIVASAPALKYYIRHTVDKYSSTPRNSDSSGKQLSGSTAYSASTTGTCVDEAGDAQDMGFFDAISSSAEKSRARSAITDFGFPSATSHNLLFPGKLDTVADDVCQWQRNRSPSVLESDLIMAGIISPDKNFGYFDKERKRMVTDDPRPVHYPWVDTSPPAEKEDV